ncbi:hypothetical protein Tco_1002677 [Tanacetum coccineum]|uniref:Uncharacterized protein n=1 Tax=Tanacetum coccineum TaxID=301880 RepID=A0ABQ5F7J5_9ASTR
MGKELEQGNFPDSLLRMVLHFECLSKKSVDGALECPREINKQIKRPGVGLSNSVRGCGGTGLSCPGLTRLLKDNPELPTRVLSKG